jgi:chaperonin GroEL
MPKLPSGVPNIKGRRYDPLADRPHTPLVVRQPRTYREVQRGFNLIANAMRPTLGPLPRLVLMEKLRRDFAPEFLDDGAAVARRIVQIEPRSQDVGAMLVRHAAWQMQREAGDGAVTMTVMYQVIANEGIRYVTVMGYNAMLLRAGLEKGMAAVTAALQAHVTPLARKEHYIAVARGLVQNDGELAEMLGEVLDIVGTDGLIVVEKGDGVGLHREYIDGTYWHISGWFSRRLITDAAEERTVFEDTALLISNVELKEPEELIPVLEKCVKAGVKKLVIVAAAVGDRVIGLLVNNNKAKTIETLAVRTPRLGEKEHVAAIEDLAVLTGGRAFYAATNRLFMDFEVSDLGHARRAWATKSLFGLFGGKGDPRAIRAHQRALRAQLPEAELDFDKRMLTERIGRLSGGTAILKIGGFTESQITTRTAMAERAVASLRGAAQAGVVVGAGVSLAAAAKALDNLPADNEEDAAAYRILARALEEPLRTIARNSGGNPDIIAERVKASPPDFGFEARTRKIINLREAGIMDSVQTVTKAVEIAVSGAAMLLTTDVIIHHAEPKESLEP